MIFVLSKQQKEKLMINKALIIVLFFLFLGCQTKIDDKKSTAVQTEKLNNIFSQLTPTNGIFHKDDINENLVLVFDTITSDNYCRWESINKKDIKGYFNIEGDFHPQNYKYLRPSHLHIKGQKKDRTLHDIGQGQFILAMSCEEEITNYVIWETIAKDSFMFLSCLTPNIVTKYSSIRILEHFLVDDQLYLINKIEGAEGGANWGSIWLCKIKDNKTIDLDRVDIGYIHDDGDWADLTYKRQNNEIKIYEERKKRKIVADEWQEISSKTKLIKSIILEQ